MNKRISGEQLTRAIRDILDEFQDKTREDIEAATDKTAKEVVKDTKAKAPVNQRPRKNAKYSPGAYKRSWTSTVTEDTAVNYVRTVHANAPHHALTHLLQNGHGGPWPAKAYPHITEDAETQRIFEENLRKEIQS